MSEASIQGAVLRALRERNTGLETRHEEMAKEVEALWKCVDAADVVVDARDDRYWKARAALTTLMNLQKKFKKSGRSPSTTQPLPSSTTGSDGKRGDDEVGDA